VAGSVNDINISQQIYYQLIQLSLPKPLIDVTPKQIEGALSHPSGNHIALSAQSRHAALMSFPLEREDARARQSIDVADEDRAQTFKKMFADPAQVYQALRAYARVSEFDRTTKHLIDIYV
jgi:hypothetical protein